MRIKLLPLVILALVGCKPQAPTAHVVFRQSETHELTGGIPGRYVLTPNGSLVPASEFTGPQEGVVFYDLPRDRNRFGAEVLERVTQRRATELYLDLTTRMSAEASIGNRRPAPTPPPARDWSALPLNALPFYPILSCGVLAGSQGDFYDAVKAEHLKMGLGEFLARANEAEGVLLSVTYQSIDYSSMRLDTGRFSGQPVIHDGVLKAIDRENDQLSEGISITLLQVEWLATDAFPAGVWSVFLRNEKQNGTLVHLLLTEQEIRARTAVTSSACAAPTVSFELPSSQSG